MASRALAQSEIITNVTSYLAAKCIAKLSEAFEKNCTKAAKVIRSDFYMDDFLSGANTDLEAQKCLREIIAILESRCFALRKSASNSKALLQCVEDRSDSDIRSLESSESISLLGVKWNS